MVDKKKTPSYKETPFMNNVRKRVFTYYPDADITYGNITTPNRKNLGLENTHYNDVIAITGINNIKDNSDGVFRIVQFRKKKRSLHEATAREGRATKNTTSNRNSKNTKQVGNWCLNDKVRFDDHIGWISGFTGKNCYIKDVDVDGNYITMSGKKYKQVNLSGLELLCRNNNWQYKVV